MAQLPPQNLEAEQSILGAVLIDNQSFIKLVGTISPEDFYRPAHGKIFSAMTELYSQSEPVDVVTLTSKLKEQGVYEEVGGAACLGELLERVPTATNVEYHAKLAADQAVKRRLITACQDLVAKGFDETITVPELLDYAEKKIFSLSQGKRSDAILPVRDIVKGAFDELVKRAENQSDITGIPTGYADLDKMTAGLQPSDLIIVACRPSMGKTSFSLGAAKNAAIHSRQPVLMFSLEMSKESIVTRLLSAEARVDGSRIRTGSFHQGDWEKLTKAASHLSNAPIFIDDTPALTAMEVRAKARRLKQELNGNLGLVIVDYLQIMGTSKSESREKAISDISRSLKALAKELSVPVIALSQLNRNIDLRQDKRPMLADLRESGAIEQDADLIIFIHREETEASQMNAASAAEFIIGKHRNGPRGTVKVAWIGQYASFENLAQD